MPGPATANDYAVLGLRPSATPAEVEQAYQLLALQHHPSRSADPRAGERFKAVLAAYERIRGAGPRTVYHVGEVVADDEPRASAQFIPFDQARPAAPPPPPTILTQLRTMLIYVQAAVAIAFLIVAGYFLVVSLTTDAHRLSDFNNSPLCIDSDSADCISQVSGTVDATLNYKEAPVFGDFTEGLRVNVVGQELTFHTGRNDETIPWGGVQSNDRVFVVRWHNQIVGVAATPDGTLPTSLTPAVIQSRHKGNALTWLILGLLTAIRPALLLGRRAITARRTPAE